MILRPARKNAGETWARLQQDVRAAGSLPPKRLFPDAPRALALCAHRDAEQARDRLLDDAYQAEASKQSERFRYLMYWAGRVR